LWRIITQRVLEFNSKFGAVLLNLVRGYSLKGNKNPAGRRGFFRADVPISLPTDHWNFGLASVELHIHKPLIFQL
jgi:hypothetical protein